MTDIVRVSTQIVRVIETALSSLPNPLVKVVDEAVAVAETNVARGVKKIIVANHPVAVVELFNWTGAQRVVIVNDLVRVQEFNVTVGPFLKVVTERIAVVETALAETELQVSGSVTRHRDRPANIRVTIADVAPITDDAAERPTMFAYTSMASRKSPSRAILAYENIDGDQTVIYESQAEPSIMGYLMSLDMRGAPIVGQWDTQSTIDVRVTSGEIESVTEGQAIAGKNRVIMGGMVFVFQTATPLSELDEYRLSGLLWGLLDSPVAMQPELGDAWAMLDGPRMSFPIPWTDLEQNKRVSFVPAGFDAAEEDEFIQLGYLGRSILPMPVANVQGTKNEAGDWTITWDRVSRLPRNRVFGPRTFHDIDGAEYRIPIKDTDGTILRTLTATGTSVVYTAAQETADFGSSQNRLSLTVLRDNDSGTSQINAIVSVPYAPKVAPP